jgi:hypothetical protein
MPHRCKILIAFAVTLALISVSISPVLSQITPGAGQTVRNQKLPRKFVRTPATDAVPMRGRYRMGASWTAPSSGR